LLLAVSSAIAAVLTFQAAEVWVAHRQIQSGHLGSIESGAALLPGNGEAWDRVGRFWQFDFANPDASMAVRAYQRAVRDDPNSSYYWMDLAGACEDVGDVAGAQKAFERAEAVYPASALVAWTYGNFLVRRQDYSAGYQMIRRAVAADKGLIPLAISRTWRASEDVNVLLDEALPPTADAYFQALRFLTAINRIDEALAVWKRLVSLGQPLALSDSFSFLDALIGSDRSDDTVRVWGEALARAGITNGETAKQSFVWNGDFSRDFANGGLDWRWTSPVGAAASFDSSPPSKSGRSLRLDFSGGLNLALDSPIHFVPVQSSAPYHFHAYVRTDNITTDRGVQISVFDPNHSGAVNALTDNFTGSHPWSAVEMDFTTGPETHFLAIRVVRMPSRMFENKLGGSALIADVSLARSGKPSHAAP
jgi:hypothetical protein